jgi:hypothetical protein
VQPAATVACNLKGKPLAGLSELSGTLGFDYLKPMGTARFRCTGIPITATAISPDLRPCRLAV